MDPLSLTTGILAVLTTCVAVGKTFAKIRRFKDAPALIQVVNNDVSDLCIILSEVSEHLDRVGVRNLESLKIDRPNLELCDATLKRTKARLQDVKDLLERRILRKEEHGEQKINWTAFLKGYSRLQQLKEDLRQDKQNIVILFGRIGIRSMSRIESLLESIHSNDLRMIEGQMRIESRVEKIDRILDTRLVQPGVRSRENLRDTALTLENEDSSGIAFAVSWSSANSDGLRCTCQCFNKVSSLYSRLGIVFVGYLTAPVVRRDYVKCPYHMDSLNVLFVFPMCFVKYSLAMQAEISRSGSIRCLLKVRQLIPPDHPVFTMIELGNVAGVKRLLTTKQVTVDAHIPAGGSILKYAIFKGSLTLIEFMLQIGAETIYVGHPWESAQKAAWDMILVKRNERAHLEGLASLFPNPNLEALYSFKALHLAVLEMPGKSLKSVLEDRDTEVNATDQSGRTALSWATLRGDARAVQTLLLHGADCNWVDNVGNSPLAYAVRTCGRCTELLLAAKANAYVKDAYRASLLCRMVGYLYMDDEPRAVKVMTKLVDAGVDVNAPRLSGETPLFLASDYGRLEIARLLVVRGADPEICNHSGATPLSQAAQRNHHALLKYFLDARLDHTQPLTFYGTFMHLMAEFADAKTLLLLNQGSLKRRDILIKNKDGLTPYQVASQRYNVGPEWRQAFSDFMKSVDQDQIFTDESRFSRSDNLWERVVQISDSESDAENEIDDSNEEFYDAVEFQSVEPKMGEDRSKSKSIDRPKHVDERQDHNKHESIDILGGARTGQSAISPTPSSSSALRRRLRSQARKPVHEE